ncbi:GntR family transcriptional regulator [Micromonospora rubida]|uniref:GntR family transcriptional regulator n=1 Tax=Micromonospora rubida TaxID=2697657 RepID=UPI0038B2534C
MSLQLRPCRVLLSDEHAGRWPGLHGGPSLGCRPSTARRPVETGGISGAGYREIAQALRESIQAGDLAPGAAVPPESEVCRRWAVSRVTARRALAVLENDGLSSQSPVAVVSSRRRTGINREQQAAPSRSLQTSGQPSRAAGWRLVLGWTVRHR